MSNVIDFTKEKEIKIIAEALADKINHNHVYAIESEDERGYGIEGTNIKVLWWSNNTISLYFDIDHAVILPRDIFQTLIAACHESGDYDGYYEWPDDIELPLMEYTKENNNDDT